MVVAVAVLCSVRGVRASGLLDGVDACVVDDRAAGVAPLITDCGLAQIPSF